jgi:hypothetical protein
MTQQKITDDLDALLDVLPLDIRHAVEKANNSDYLLEIILDLGRVATARFVEEEIVLTDKEITRAEIDYVDERTGEIDADKRAGIERTLIASLRFATGVQPWWDSLCALVAPCTAPWISFRTSSNRASLC